MRLSAAPTRSGARLELKQLEVWWIAMPLYHPPAFAKWGPPTCRPVPAEQPGCHHRVRIRLCQWRRHTTRRKGSAPTVEPNAAALPRLTYPLRTLLEVPKAGLEPAWPESHCILSAARLPIPPLGRVWCYPDSCEIFPHSRSRTSVLPKGMPAARKVSTACGVRLRLRARVASAALPLYREIFRDLRLHRHA